MSVKMSVYIEIRIYDTDKKQTHKQNNKMEFLTIYCFVFLLKMKPWGSFQVNETSNVFFMTLRGCFISKIVLNLSFRWVKKIFVKSDSMFTVACEQVLYVWVRKCQPIKTLNDKFSLVGKHRSSNQRPWTMIFH